jgi:2-keto-4-pentenoate hydratase/2-oxohepta-3-ene-1,7-dioic acid hydratase in catechol pathway
MQVPSEAEEFAKATSSICGPDDDIIQPLNSEKLDREIELAIVFGKHTSYVSEEEAASHIARYCVCNAVSECAFQLEKGGQWDKGKGCDTLGPIGPWLVTRDKVEDPSNLNMWLEMYGNRYQDGNMQTMVFGPAFIVSYLSQFMSLQPGDVISSGTPPGVGLGQKPPVYLAVGDKIRLGIEGIGTQSQTVAALRNYSASSNVS